jgi:hypothetical protein
VVVDAEGRLLLSDNPEDVMVAMNYGKLVVEEYAVAHLSQVWLYKVAHSRQAHQFRLLVHVSFV